MKKSSLFFLFCLVGVSPSHSQNIDLKSQTQVIFREGQLYIVDIYEREKISFGTNVLNISLLQFKSVENNQTCGTLTDRRVRLSSGNQVIELRQTQFEEFLGATNYFSKFVDSWESMRSKKQKFLRYQFEREGRDGDYQGLFEISGTQDLSLIHI